MGIKLVLCRVIYIWSNLGMNGITTQPLLIRGLSNPRIAELSERPGRLALNSTAKPRSPAVGACLQVNLLVMPRTAYWGSKEKHSIIHHAQASRPSRNNLFIILFNLQIAQMFLAYYKVT